MSLSDHMFSDATRQAWRDNYNSGRAAGDFAGVYSNPGGSRDYSVSSGQTAGDGNDRSDGSATFAGVVKASGASGVPHAPSASRLMATEGPGSPGAGRDGGSGSGSRLVISGGAPLEIKHSNSGMGLYVGGDWWHSNPWWSDAEDWEARYAEPGEWVGGLVVMGADLYWNAGRAINSIPATNEIPDRQNQPRFSSGWVTEDDGVSWQFVGDGKTPAYLWDAGGRSPDISPWR